MEKERNDENTEVEEETEIPDTLTLDNISLSKTGSSPDKKTKLTVMAKYSNSGDSSLIPDLNDDMSIDILAWCSRSDYPKLACLNKSFMSLVKSGHLYKLRSRLGITEHWVYLASILIPWEAYSPVKNKWMRLPITPCDDCFNYADKESLGVGTELLVFGREISGFAIWKYSLGSSEWSRAAPMRFGRCLFASGSFGSVGIVAGGTDETSTVLKRAELYDSELGTWETLPDMIMARKLCSGCFMDGKFYAIGGMSNYTDSLSCGEEYDMETRTWRRIPGMYPVVDTGTPRAQCSPPLIAVVKDRLYAADMLTNEVKRYDKGKNTWDVVNMLPIMPDLADGWGLAFRGCGEKLVVIGGSRRPHGDAMVLHAWEPDRVDRGRDWRVLSVRNQLGGFVYNCAIMGC